MPRRKQSRWEVRSPAARWAKHRPCRRRVRGCLQSVHCMPWLDASRQLAKCFHLCHGAYSDPRVIASFPSQRLAASLPRQTMTTLPHLCLPLGPSAVSSPSIQCLVWCGRRTGRCRGERAAWEWLIMLGLNSFENLLTQPDAHITSRHRYHDLLSTHSLFFCHLHLTDHSMTGLLPPAPSPQRHALVYV